MAESPDPSQPLPTCIQPDSASSQHATQLQEGGSGSLLGCLPIFLEAEDDAEAVRQRFTFSKRHLPGSGQLRRTSGPGSSSSRSVEKGFGIGRSQEDTCRPSINHTLKDLWGRPPDHEPAFDNRTATSTTHAEQPQEPFENIASPCLTIQATADAKQSLASTDPRLKTFSTRNIHTFGDKSSQSTSRMPQVVLPELDQVWKLRSNSNRDLASGRELRQVLGDSGRALGRLSEARSPPVGLSGPSIDESECAYRTLQRQAATRPTGPVDTVATPIGTLATPANQYRAHTHSDSHEVAPVAPKMQVQPRKRSLINSQDVGTGRNRSSCKSTTAGENAGSPVDREAAKRARVSGPDLRSLNDSSKEFMRNIEALGRQRDNLRVLVTELESQINSLRASLTKKSQEFSKFKEASAAIIAKAQDSMRSVDEIKRSFEEQRAACRAAQSRAETDLEHCREAVNSARAVVKDADGTPLKDVIYRIRVEAIADVRVAMQRIEDLESELLNLKQSREQALFDRAGAQERVKELEHDHKSQMAKYESKCCELAEISARLSEQQGAVSAIKLRCNEILSSKAAIQSAKEDLERRLGVAEGKETASSAELSEARNTLLCVQEKLKTSEERIIGLGKELSEAERKLEAATKEINLAEDRYRESQGAQEAILRNLRAVQKEKSELEGRFQEITDSLHLCQVGAERCNQLAEERAIRLEELRTENCDLKTATEDLKNQLERRQELEMRLAAERARTETLVESFASMESRFAESSSLKCTAEATVVQLRGQLDRIQHRCEELSRDYEEAQDGNRTASESIERLRSDLDAAEKQALRSQADLVDLNEKYGEVVEIVAKNKTELALANHTIESLESRVAEMGEHESGTAHTLQNALQNQEALELGLHNERKARDQETNELREKTNALEKEVLSTRQEREKLQNQIKALEASQAQSIEREASVIDRARRGLLTRAEVDLCNYSATLQRDQHQREMSKKDNEIKRLEFERRALEDKIIKAHVARSKVSQVTTKRTLPVLSESSSAGASDSGSRSGSSPQRDPVALGSLLADCTHSQTLASIGAADAAVAPRRSSRMSVRTASVSTDFARSSRCHDPDSAKPARHDPAAPDSRGGSSDNKPSNDSGQVCHE